MNNSSQTRLIPLICRRCGTSTTELHPRGWEAFSPGKEVCSDCIGFLLEDLTAAISAYLKTPQGQARILAEMKAEIGDDLL